GNVTITLDVHRTAGYCWELAGHVNETMLKFASSVYIAGEAGLVGAPGQEVWTFKAISAGRTELSFKCVRPWEKGVPPAEVRSFTVEIRPGASDQGE
ncbi:protease inhibitor I42 family protein, partial [Candidatus Omnitrophota bacterium]